MAHVAERQIAPPLEQLTDAEVAARVLRGERALFELIMRRYNRRLFRIARGILGNDAAAEDALQDAYISAYFKLAQFRGAESLGGWLCQIVTNHALMQRRRARVTLASLSELDEPSNAEAAMTNTLSVEGNPAIGIYEQQLRRLLEAAIDALPEVYRAAFVLREVEQMSVAETARCLDIEEATVKTRVHRARRILQRNLSGEFSSALRSAFGFDGERCDRIVARVLSRLA